MYVTSCRNPKNGTYEFPHMLAQAFLMPRFDQWDTVSPRVNLGCVVVYGS